VTKRVERFNFSRWPGKPMLDDEVMRLVHDAGWRKQAEAVEALATFIAESRLVARAYLARVDLPRGAYFLVEKDEDDEDVTVFRSPRYQEIRETSSSWPASLSLQSARSKFKAIDCTVASSDRGLVQSNEDYDPVADRIAFEPVRNIQKGYDIYVRRSRTFAAWYANLSGAHRKNLPRARASWDRLYERGVGEWQG
jgi:hypothetical protein